MSPIPSAGVSAFLRLLPDKVRNTLAVHLGRPDLRSSLLQLRRFGFMPKQLLDGGAYRGDWTRLCLEIWPEASVLCVEPQESVQTVLKALEREKAPRIKIKQCLLGEADTLSVPFSQAGTGSSVLTSTKHGALLPMCNIDSLIDERVIAFDFVKLDVQGYELQVLAGFERYWEQCEVLELELSLIPIVAKAPLLSDVVPYLQRRGFVMCDVNEIIRAPSDGAVWQIDALFCREDSIFRSERRWR